MFVKFEPGQSDDITFWRFQMSVDGRNPFWPLRGGCTIGIAGKALRKTQGKTF
jgi:hypothetical protein